MKITRALFASVALLVASLAQAATFNLFSPAAGILKGNPSTYVTTAATSADVIATWTGTCNSTTFLRADGGCAVPSGTGVTSVALTVPSGLSVTGSPITSTGTLGITTALSGVVKANGSGFTAGTVNLTTEVTGTLPVANGGIGVATLTGIAKGNGTSAFTAATSTNIIATWTGTCDNTTFLRGDGQCAAGAGGSGANPTATIGLTAVNGVAASFIRSDGAPALSQSIAPTWTAQHSFTLTGNANTSAVYVNSASPSYGWNETDASADNRLWDAVPVSGVMNFRAVNDAASVANAYMTATRSGASITKVAFPNGNVEVGIALVPDTDTGAAIGTSALRMANVFGSTLCDGACATSALSDSTGTTARFGNGSTWTAIALPHPTAVTGTLSASGLITATGGVNILAASTVGAAVSWGGSGVIRTDNGAGTWAVTNTAGSTTYFGINNLSGEFSYGSEKMLKAPITMRIVAGRFQANTGGGCTTVTSTGLGTCSAGIAFSTSIPFSTAYSAAPWCTASAGTGTANNTVAVNSSTTAVTVNIANATAGAAPGSNTNFDVICTGSP